MDERLLVTDFQPIICIGMIVPMRMASVFNKKFPKNKYCFLKILDLLLYTKICILELKMFFENTDILEPGNIELDLFKCIVFFENHGTFFNTAHDHRAYIPKKRCDFAYIPKIRGTPPHPKGGFGTGIVESCKSWKFQCAPQARFFLDLQACIRGDFYVFGNSN